jgi:secreted trypsin-like serine protease
MPVEDLTRGVSLRYGDEAGTRHAGRYLLALVFATLMALGAAVPVFAAEEPAEDDGGTVQPQVVGGEPVPDGKYPFMVSIQADTSNARPYREHFCGGTLIDPDSVLTAAHCADEIGAAKTPATVSFRDIRLAIGVTKLNTSQGEARGIASFSDIRIHPLFDDRTRKYDAAVIELDARVDLEPITLAPEEEGDNLERPRTDGVVAGWGNTIKQGANLSQRDRFPERLQRGTPPIVSDRKAERAYGRLYFSPLMVAAGQIGEDTCQGDSGGPLWVTTEAGKRQIGITSFGLGCGKRGFPGVYTEVNNPSISTFIEGAAAN